MSGLRFNGVSQDSVKVLVTTLYGGRYKTDICSINSGMRDRRKNKKVGEQVIQQRVIYISNISQWVVGH